MTNETQANLQAKRAELATAEHIAADVPDGPVRSYYLARVKRLEREIAELEPLRYEAGWVPAMAPGPDPDEAD